MKFIKGIKNIRYKFKRPVLAIGIFDGVHLAHQKIIKEVVQQAKGLKGTSIVLTFSPHPGKIVAGYASVPLITSFEHRIALIKQLNVDVCLSLDFSKEFSQMSAEAFAKHILINAIGVNYVIVGEGFHFGKDKSGSFSLLQKLSKIYDFKIRQIETIKMFGQLISSTKIRSLIKDGKIEQANRLLGRNFSIYGRVKRGVARGRILGYPTANIKPQQEITPACGVYVVFVKLNKKNLAGILNIGTRPTFGVKSKLLPTIEVHIFNFHKDLYGRNIEVFFIKRIRAETRFASQEALLGQIKKDELEAKEILKFQKITPPNQSTFVRKI